MFAAVARPSGGPFPVVLVLHGTHGFARQYVELAQDLARAGFLAVAGCWFSGAENPNNPRGAAGSGAGVNAVSAPIPCPEVPPLGPGAYEEGLQYIDALVQAARARCRAHVPIGSPLSDTHAEAAQACNTYWR
jgi:dienelactone hydrolase